MYLKRIRPNYVTYHMLIRAFQRVGEGNGSISVFEKMKANGLQPSIESYLLIIKLMSKTDSKRSFELLREMASIYVPSYLNSNGPYSPRKSNASQNEETIFPLIKGYTSIISAIGQKRVHSSYLQAFRYFTRASQLGIKPDSIFYASMISVALDHLEIEEAEKLLKEAFEKSPRPNVALYNQQMEIFLQKQQPSNAIVVFSKIKSSPSLLLNANSYVIMIKASFSLPISLDEAAKSAKAFFQEALQQRHIITRPLERRRLFTKYLQILGEHSQIEEMVQVYDQMINFNITPSLNVFHALLADFGKFENLPMVERVYSDMLERRIKPNNKTYQILTDICRIDPLSVIVSIPENEKIFTKIPEKKNSLSRYLATFLQEQPNHD